ncbi:hypothetical protein F2P56_032260 [Juglans regia]|uniref:UDP-glycosyltransferase 87A1-like n=2 Tax=Juglans regia TaxID=51240 RepID=A0A2I4F9Z0_JUGRE|nr:UDP-glycosyltransferase 87A1-like [Juglans regia]KAF5446649.1 hypothetical protein F2P56_032260 [Juglans regia]
MMNLCKQLVLKSPSILVTFVVTEEWLGFIGEEPKPATIRYATIPNVIPSDHDRAKDFSRFFQAINTKMEAPFEELLDRLEHPVSAIVADTYMTWVVRLGNRRNIPVASLITMSATVFSVLHHFELLVRNGHFPAELSGEMLSKPLSLSNFALPACLVVLWIREWTRHRACPTIQVPEGILQQFIGAKPPSLIVIWILHLVETIVHKRMWHMLVLLLLHRWVLPPLEMLHFVQVVNSQ